MLRKYQFAIAAVSEETGIAKEVLRKWEQRYGFPAPVRDVSGVRRYCKGQIERLKLLKQLMDDGLRPGQLVSLAESELASLIAAKHLNIAVVKKSQIASDIIQWLKAYDPDLLRAELRREMLRRGLREFVLTAMPAMNRAVGDAWASGDISVKDEHLYTESVQELIRIALAPLRSTGPVRGTPRILLTTLTGEAHTLGILMLEVLMTLEGATCISLGAQTPLPEIAAAVEHYQINIIALSFSVSFAKKKILLLLRELRSSCPPPTQLWAGGSGVADLDKSPRGLRLLPALPEAIQALQEYRLKYPVPG
ncbi:HTH-type transcriptional repressor CarH [soil metagenome]